MSGWDVTKVRLWALIRTDDDAGEEELDVVRFAARFPLNDIPRGTMTLAVGRNVKDGTPSPVHALVSKAKVKRRVRVMAQVETTAALLGRTENAWPAGAFVLFDGYTVGAGYQRSGNSADYTIEVEHWLADLAYASAVSAVSAPGNPAAMTFPALTAMPAESGEATARTGGYTGLTTAENYVTAETVAKDFWGAALQPFFLGLTDLEEFAGTDAAAQAGIDLGEAPAGNAAARLALERIEPLPEKEYSAPLAFDPAAYGGDMAEVAAQIEQALGAETLELLAGATLWDKLVQYAATYMFAVVPLVDRALVVPFIPGLRTHHATIRARQSEYARLSGDMPRVLRGIGIYGGKGFEGGGEMTADDAVDYDQFSVGGYFEGASTGQVVFKQAPMWMATVTLSAEVDRATGGDGLPAGDAINPGAGRPPEGSPPSERAAANARLMDAYAQAVYAYESLKLRGGELGSPFRLDIAPGSTVRVEVPGDKFLEDLGADELAQTMYATVLQVDVHLDAEAPRAGTGFRLAHWRNPAENESPGFSLDRHPIWKDVWAGAPLLKLDGASGVPAAAETEEITGDAGDDVEPDLGEPVLEPRPGVDVA